MTVAESAAAIRAGEADRMLAAGHDTPFEPETVLYYHSLGLLSDAAPRPFDSYRSGTVFGEGAGAVVLETVEDATARGADCAWRIPRLGLRHRGRRASSTSAPTATAWPARSRWRSPMQVFRPATSA